MTSMLLSRAAELELRADGVEPLTEHEVVAMATQIFGGGTAAGFLGHLFMHLIGRPDIVEPLRRDRSLIPQAGRS